MIPRHTLVWLRREPEAIVPEQQETVAVWHRAGRPFVTARTRCGEELSLGFCLPREAARPGPVRRVGARARAEWVDHREPPPPFTHWLGKKNPSWKVPEGIKSLQVRLIGSHMWELLTGDSFTRPESDLDVLVTLGEGESAETAVKVLGELDASAPMRVDGELSFPRHGEVNWREYASASPELLCKNTDGVRLMARAQLTSP